MRAGLPAVKRGGKLAGLSRAWQHCCMKLLLALALASGLLAAALFVPVAGRSFWGRAEERGLPRAAASLTARGLRASWDFVHGLGQHASSQALATPKPPAHSPRARKAAARSEAAAAAGPAAVVGPALATASLVPSPQQPHKPRDGIVAQAPKERLESNDKLALDRLVGAPR